jgi:hypothetical protein
MLPKLELDALRADLAAVNALLAARTEEEDPSGRMQFESRKREIEQAIRALENAPEHTASVALFFGGRPVFGSKGIAADFAGKAVEMFQDLVSKRFAGLESGSLGERGPVPLRANTQLMLTDVARGSVGFVLEEAAENGTLTDSSLKQVMDEVADLLTRVASPDTDLFESAMETLDPRLLISLRDFYRHLDEAGATLRIVEGPKDDLLDSEAVRRGRARTETMEIKERESEEIMGTLWLLPAHRKFELRRANTGDVIYGNVANEYSRLYLESLQSGPDAVVGKTWKTKMRIREVQELNRPPKFSYTLLGLVEVVPTPGSIA